MHNKATHARTVVGEGEEEEGEGKGQDCQGLIGEEGASHPTRAARAAAAGNGSGGGGLEGERGSSTVCPGQALIRVLLSCLRRVLMMTLLFAAVMVWGVAGR